MVVLFDGVAPPNSAHQFQKLLPVHVLVDDRSTMIVEAKFRRTEMPNPDKSHTEMDIDFDTLNHASVHPFCSEHGG